MSQLVLSLFPGIGLLDMAFEEAGFCVVRGPDLLWGGDVQRFHPPAGKFDGVIGGPPCQAFSRLRHIVEANGYQTAPNLIPEFERVVEAARPQWFVMENVPDAPEPKADWDHIRGRPYVVQSVMLRDVWVGGETNRLRRFSFGYCDAVVSAPRFEIDTLALHRTDPEQAALASGGMRAVPVAVGGSGKRKISARSAMRNREPSCSRDFASHCRLQGLPNEFDLPPFTTAAKVKAVGNGVPLPMGRAVAAAVKRALGRELAGAAA